MLKPLVYLSLLFYSTAAFPIQPETVRQSTQPVANLSVQTLSEAVSSQDEALLQRRLDKLFSGGAGNGLADGPALVALPGGAKTDAPIARPPFDRRQNSLAPPPGPANSPPGKTGNGSFLRFMKFLARHGDVLEDAVIRKTLGFKPSRLLILKTLGTENITLYRGIDPLEKNILTANGGAYDPRDQKNFYKFATPSKDAALLYARKHHGYVLEVKTDQAIPYYKLSRFWNEKGWDKSVREYLILTTGKEELKVHPLENTR